MSARRSSNCPSLEALDRFVAGGSLDPAVTKHLEECAHCAARAKRIRRNEAFLAQWPARDGPGPSTSSAATSLPAVDGYEIIGEMHRGGQGVVYRARQTATKRIVALKVLIQGTLATSRQRRRFEREVELAATLQHPNIVTIHDSGTTVDGRHYYAMAYIDGVTLDRHVRSVLAAPAGSGRRAAGESLRLFSTICAAVSYAHQRGVIHRDLKPANIIIDGEGRPHIVDFGLAKALDNSTCDVTTDFTQTGEFVGTLAYASPEQVSGDPDRIDVRSDVYSLGVILYEMLTGRFPYAVTGRMDEVIRAIAEAEPERPSKCSRGAARRAGIRPQAPLVRIDDELETILLEALAKDPQRRYQSAEQFKRDIDRYLAGEPIDAKRDSNWYVLRKTLRRHMLAVGVGAAFVVVLTAAFTISTVFWRRAVADRGLAVNNEQVAREKLTFALQAIDRLVFDTNDTLQTIYGTEQVRANLLDVALEFFDRLPVDAAALGIEIHAGPAFGKFADILLEKGQRQRAAEYVNRSLEIARRGVAASPDDSQRLRELGFGVMRQGLLQRDPQARRDAMTESLALFERVAELTPQSPTARDELADAVMRLAHSHSALGQSDDALACMTRAVLLQDDPADASSGGPQEVLHKLDLLTAAAYLALACHAPDQADSWSNRAVAVADDLAEHFPADSQIQYAHMSHMRKRADILLKLARREHAAEVLAAARTLADALLDREPANVLYRVGVGEVYQASGNVAVMSDELADAEGWYGKTLAIVRPLFELQPDDDSYRLKLANLHFTMGHLEFAAGKEQEAASQYRLYLSLTDPIAEKVDLATGRAFACLRIGGGEAEGDADGTAYAAGIKILEEAAARRELTAIEQEYLAELRTAFGAAYPAEQEP